MNTPTLQPCPSCGNQHTLVLTTFRDIADPDGDLGLEDCDSVAVVCDASRPQGPGGCGASGGYAATDAEAITFWNTRALVAVSAPERMPIEVPILRPIATQIDAMQTLSDEGQKFEAFAPEAPAVQQAIAEAAAFSRGHDAGWASAIAHTQAQAAQPVRKPLTDARLDAAIAAWFCHLEPGDLDDDFRARMRAAIDAAHGIGKAQ